MYSYYFIVFLSMALGLGAYAVVRGRMRKYSRIGVSTEMTGREAALKMLSDNGVTNVSVHRGAEGQDHFDPRTNSISLSPSNYDSPSLTATATACHEAGHALQFAQNYRPLFIRASLVPAVNFCSNAWFFVFFIGVVMQLAGLTFLACIIYTVVVLFQVVTLPVEFNASSRALKYMQATGFTGNELKASSRLLRACAMTYVVAALMAAVQLLWIMASSSRD